MGAGGVQGVGRSIESFLGVGRRVRSVEACSRVLGVDGKASMLLERSCKLMVLDAGNEAAARPRRRPWCSCREGKPIGSTRLANCNTIVQARVTSSAAMPRAMPRAEATAGTTRSPPSGGCGPTRAPPPRVAAAGYDRVRVLGCRREGGLGALGSHGEGM